MLPDLSPAHILIVVVVALVVVGPKDLPMLLRKIGQFMGKMRGMANEFRASFDEMARQSELDELRKEVEAMRLAANAATPDLGVTDALKDAEGAYMSQWQDSMATTSAHAAPEASVAPPPPPEIAPPEPPSQPDAPLKTRKPRAKKPKPEAETGA